MDINYGLIRIISGLTFIYILRLIYGHKLRIGHSWFLFLLGSGFFVLSIWPKTLNILGYITGTNSWLSNISFFLVLFLLIIIVHCTLMISSLISRVKELGQQLAILSSEIDEKSVYEAIEETRAGGASARFSTLNAESFCLPLITCDAIKDGPNCADNKLNTINFGGGILVKTNVALEEAKKKASHASELVIEVAGNQKDHGSLIERLSNPLPKMDKSTHQHISKVGDSSLGFQKNHTQSEEKS